MMRSLLKSTLILAALLGLSACSAPSGVSRNATMDSVAPLVSSPVQDWSVVDLRIDVPRTLTVSEANSIRPNADIVWRGDPLGDRHDQIDALMTSALAPVLTPRDTGGTPVIVTLELRQFHAVTELARYTVGGLHAFVFTLTVAHAETGEILSGPRTVDLTYRVAGGQAALDEEARGITQRARVIERLQTWARAEFPVPAADLLSVAAAQN